MKRISLSPRVHVLQGEELEDHVRENAGFVISERGVVVIDSTRTLTDARWAYGQIRAVTDKKILYVINTHFHADHVFGNQLFDAPVIAHRVCRERMQGLLQSDWSPEGLARQAAEQADPEALAGLRIVLPEIVFEGGLSLELGDLTLEILHLGGHTPGSSIVYLPQEEILYIGDLLFVKRYPAVIPGIVNTERWVAALERIEGMRIQTVVPGHGPVSTLEQVSRL